MMLLSGRAAPAAGFQQHAAICLRGPAHRVRIGNRRLVCGRAFGRATSSSACSLAAPIEGGWALERRAPLPRFSHGTAISLEANFFWLRFFLLTLPRESLFRLFWNFHTLRR